MLLLCTQLLIPGALWHCLSGHHDTRDCEIISAQPSVSEQHLHCPGLDLILQVAELVDITLVLTDSIKLPELLFPVLSNESFRFFVFQALRGPPAKGNVM